MTKIKARFYHWETLVSSVHMQIDVPDGLSEEELLEHCLQEYYDSNRAYDVDTESVKTEVREFCAERQPEGDPDERTYTFFGIWHPDHGKWADSNVGPSAEAALRDLVTAMCEDAVDEDPDGEPEDWDSMELSDMLNYLQLEIAGGVEGDAKVVY